MPTLCTPRFLVTPLVLLLVESKKVEYWQNCAARGLCDSLFHLREHDTVHKSPEGSPKGHWKPLGHPDFLEAWEGEVDTFHDAPTPEIFWTKYHAHRRPFIVKGAVTESAAMNWTDQYIMDHFGDEVAKVEWRNEDRLTDYCGQQIKGKYIHCPQDTIPYVESRTSIRNFIQKSQNDPSWAKYIISQMPDAMGKLTPADVKTLWRGDLFLLALLSSYDTIWQFQKDWKVPGFFNCGKRFEGDRIKGKPWMTQMYENNFWYLRVPPEKMGTSTIHYDMNHQVMCMFAGKKEWIMWDLRTESKKIPMWNEYYRAPSQGKPQGSDDSPIDGERVDLKRWPEFGSARWRNTTIEKGDCLYLPAHLLHYVRSWSDDPEDHRIIALMTMFQSEESYDPSYCKDVPSHSYLSDYDVMWGEFPGSMEVPRCMNHVKMGFPNWKRMLAKLAKKEVGEKAFVKFWAKEGYPKKRIKAAWQRFMSSDVVASDTMTWAEKVFNSTALTNLAKDVACGMEGHEGPERKLREGESWDARNEYSLAGDYKGYTDEKHEEL